MVGAPGCAATPVREKVRASGSVRRAPRCAGAKRPASARSRAALGDGGGGDELVIVPLVDDPAAAVFEAQADVNVVAFDQRETSMPRPSTYAA